MRIFLKLENNRVVYQVESERPPGGGPGLPANMMEATDRTDGPWMGKVYNPATDTFSDPPLTRIEHEALLLGRPYEAWLRWKTTRLEATTRLAPAVLITALTARENAAWTDYLAALQAWRGAS